MGRVSSALTLVVGTWPASRVKNQLLRWLGHEIGKGVTIGPSLVVRTHLSLGDDAVIGGLSVFLRLALKAGPSSHIGKLNWVACAPELVAGATKTALTIPGTLIVGDHASLTSRHYIDASGGVTFGRYSTLAGARSTIFTHGIDLNSNTLLTKAVTVGDFSLVGSNVSFAPGAVVPAYSAVGMGAVVVGTLTEPYMLYVGSPAQPKKRLPPDAQSFHRTVGAVPPPSKEQNY